MIERIHLKIVRELDRRGSLTAAADALHLTQSALSHAIKKFEQQTGCAVWQKEGRAIRFTPAGKTLLGVANRVLPQLEHADELMYTYAKGEKGTLRIGMECHPCYQWLLTVVEPFLESWPAVDVDVKQRFQFGGMAALHSFDIDILVTPDPIQKPGLRFMPVFAYEQVLLVSSLHPLVTQTNVYPEQLSNQILYTYPVEPARLDIFTQFLSPSQIWPKKHKTVEATEIMLQLVAAGRGVAALPAWLADRYARTMPIKALRLGDHGIQKTISLGLRDTEEPPAYLTAFLDLAKQLDDHHSEFESP